MLMTRKDLNRRLAELRARRDAFAAGSPQADELNAQIGVLERAALRVCPTDPVRTTTITED